MRSLGEAGEIEPETNSILTEYEIDDEDFPSNVLECLPSLGPDGHWKIPEVYLGTAVFTRTSIVSDWRFLELHNDVLIRHIKWF